MTVTGTTCLVCGKWIASGDEHYCPLQNAEEN